MLQSSTSDDLRDGPTSEPGVRPRVDGRADESVETGERVTTPSSCIAYGGRHERVTAPDEQNESLLTYWTAG